MRPMTTIALMLVGILIVAGCGGGGGGSDDAGGSNDSVGNDAGNADTTTSKSISKAEFIEEADAVCTNAGKKAQAEFASYLKDNNIEEGGKLTPQQTEDVAKDILAPVLRHQVDEIRALGAPEQDQLQIVSFLSEVEAAANKAEKNPTVAIQSPDQLLGKADAIVEDYGFKVCAQREGSSGQ